MRKIDKSGWETVVSKIALKRADFEEAIANREEDLVNEYYLEITAEFEKAICLIPFWRFCFKRKAIAYFETTMAEMSGLYERLRDEK